MGCFGGDDGGGGTGEKANTKVEPFKGEEVSVDTEDLNGPIKKRGCTDIIFLVVFLVALGGSGYVGYISYEIGDPYRILYGHDSWGNTCQRPNHAIENVSLSGRDMTGLSGVFYFNILALMQPQLFTSKVLCVKECPDEMILTDAQFQTYTTSSSNYLCQYDVPVASYSGTDDDCPNLPIVKHSTILNRCLPSDFLALGSSMLGVVSSVLNTLEATCTDAGDFFTKATNDIMRTHMEILYMLGISVGVSFAVIILMRFIAAIVVWTLVIGTALACVAGTLYLWYRWHTYNTLLEDIPVDERLAADISRVEEWFTYSIIATVVAVIILLVLLVLRSRIALVVQLFREASQVMVKIPFLLIQPVWTLAALLVFVSGFGILFLWVWTAGDPVIDGNGYVSFEPDETLFYLKWYYIFVVLWVVQFVFACHMITIAGAVADWYFARDKSKLSFPIMKSIGRLLMYHMGSAAFGSFIVALIQFARLVLGYIQSKLHGKAGPLVEFLLKVLQCCLWCFEKFIKFINKNAYIMIAIHGYNFCKGAQKGFKLILSNILRVAALNSVGTFCLFLGKIGSVAIVVVIGLEAFFKNNTEICFIWVPLSVAGVGAFLISHTFFSVYSMTIDTIFLCFCEDSERNDGITKPYYMSKGLMAYVDNSRKALDVLNKRAEVMQSKYK